MKYLKKSRSYYYGVLEAGEHVPDGVLDTRKHPENGRIKVRFPIGEYANWKACEDRVERLAQVKAFDALPGIRKQFSVHTKSVEISDSDWEQMCKLMVDPSQFKREDFRVYESWLCHNVVDRDGERFNVDVLRSFEKSIIGKAVLTGHDWAGTGEGRYFNSHLEKVDIDEMTKLAGPHPAKGLKEQYKHIESRDKGLFWLVAGYYLLADDVEKIRKIDSGIISDMSIGFRAPELGPVKSESGDKILWWEYRNTGEREAEALEGSHVFLGSQYGARTRKSADLQAIALENPHISDGHVDEGKSDLIDKVIKFGCLAGEVENDAEAVLQKRDDFTAMTIPQLQAKCTEYQDILKCKHPNRENFSIQIENHPKAAIQQQNKRNYRAPVLLEQKP